MKKENTEVIQKTLIQMMKHFEEGDLSSIQKLAVEIRPVAKEQGADTFVIYLDQLINLPNEKIEESKEILLHTTEEFFRIKSKKHN